MNNHIESRDILSTSANFDKLLKGVEEIKQLAVLIPLKFETLLIHSKLNQKKLVPLKRQENTIIQLIS